MQDLKTDGMSWMGRLIVFLILTALLVFWEMAKRESGAQQSVADRNEAAEQQLPESP
jgi:hypothetical protein